MLSDERATGTPEDATGTPDPIESGTPPGDDGSTNGDGDGSALEAVGSDGRTKEELLEELERERNARKQLLSEKSKWERKAQEPLRGTEPTPDTQRAESERALAEIHEDMREVQAIANLPATPQNRSAIAFARTQLRTLDWQQRQHQDVLRRMEYGTVPDDERDQVQELVDSGQVASVALAREIVQARTRQNQTDESQRAKADKADAVRAKRDSAPTLSRGAAPVNLRGGPLPDDEYIRRVSDENVPYAERQKLIRAQHAAINRRP